MNHSFDVATAEKYGVEEAIFIENMRFWLDKNKANERHFYDGRYWTYNSAKAFAKLFPYWSASQVNRIIKKLETEGVLVSGNYNQSAYDRTKWYSLNEEIHFTNPSNGNDEIEKTLIRTDSKPEVNTDADAPQKRATSLPTGFLPNETGHSYALQRGLDTTAQLQSFKNHHQAKGSTFKDWQAAWRTWCDKAVQFGGARHKTHADGRPLNKQEALEASNRAVVARFLEEDAMNDKR